MSTTSASDDEVLRKDGNWQKCKAHQLCEVGALLRTSGVSSDDVTNISRERLEREVLKLRLEALVFSWQPMVLVQGRKG